MFEILTAIHALPLCLIHREVVSYLQCCTQLRQVNTLEESSALVNWLPYMAEILLKVT